MSSSYLISPRIQFPIFCTRPQHGSVDDTASLRFFSLLSRAFSSTSLISVLVSNLDPSLSSSHSQSSSYPIPFSFRFLISIPTSICDCQVFYLMTYLITSLDPCPHLRRNLNPSLSMSLSQSLCLYPKLLSSHFFVPVLLIIWFPVFFLTSHTSLVPVPHSSTCFQPRPVLVIVSFPILILVLYTSRPVSSLLNSS